MRACVWAYMRVCVEHGSVGARISKCVQGPTCVSLCGCQCAQVFVGVHVWESVWLPTCASVRVWAPTRAHLHICVLAASPVGQRRPVHGGSRVGAGVRACSGQCVCMRVQVLAHSRTPAAYVQGRAAYTLPTLCLSCSP